MTEFQVIPIHELPPEERAKRAIKLLADSWEHVRHEFDHLEKDLARAEEWRIWEYLDAGTLDEVTRRDLGVSLDTMHLTIVEKRKDAQKARAQADGGVVQGRHLDNIQMRVPEGGGTRKSYLLRRLARDYPDILDGWERQEYPSVRQAAIAAGIVKVPTPLEAVQKAISRLSEDDHRALILWLQSTNGGQR